MRPLLTVVIATKDREKYCIAAIKSILNMRDNRIQIAVSDNSRTQEVKEYVEYINSPQISYSYDNSFIPFIENFNNAMDLATGEYVILIGDDDAILPRLVNIAEWAKKNNIDSVAPTKTVTYFWPNTIDMHPDGFIEYTKGTGKISKVDSRVQLEKLVKNGLQLYMLYNLPKTYHGLVKKDLVDCVKTKTGHYYGGVSPDIYSSVSIACLNPNHYIIDEPLSIAGVCPISGTAGQIKGHHSGELKDIPHLKHLPDYSWDELIPQFYSVNTIWAEAGIKALEEMNEQGLIKKFNFYNLFAHATANNYRFIPEILKREKQKIRINNEISRSVFCINMGAAYTKLVVSKIKRELKKRMSEVYTHDNVGDIMKVIGYVQHIK